MKARFAAVAALSMLLASPCAFAQKVYRCGSNYSQTPCPAGTAIEVDDARSADQKKQTDAAAKRDARLADDMEKARLKQEAQAAPALVVGSKAPPAEKPPKTGNNTAAKKKSQKKKESGEFTATDGKTGTPGKKREKS